MSRKWLLWFVPLFFVLTGCEERYRYPCQDPNNWNEDFCKKPLCEINRSCPEHIFKEDLMNGSINKDKECKR